jgi:hypothetical protein
MTKIKLLIRQSADEAFGRAGDASTIIGLLLEVQVELVIGILIGFEYFKLSDYCILILQPG